MTDITKYPEMTPIPAGFRRWSGGNITPNRGIGWCEYILRMEMQTIMQAEISDLDWRHDQGDGDIVAYRLI